MTATTCDIVGVWHGFPARHGGEKQSVVGGRRMPGGSSRVQQSHARVDVVRGLVAATHPGPTAVVTALSATLLVGLRAPGRVRRRASRWTNRRTAARPARRTTPGRRRTRALGDRPGGWRRARSPPRSGPDGWRRPDHGRRRRARGTAAPCSSLRASCGLRQLIAFLRRDVLGTPCQTPTMSHVVAVMPVPAPHAYPQAEIASVIGPILVRDPTRRSLLERLHAASGVARRTLALPLAEYATLRDFGTANEAFVRVGTD